MKKVGLSLAFITLIMVNIAHADMNSEMAEMFNRMGFSTNPTGPGYYEGQTRGFYTGGSMAARTPYEHINPLSLSFPSINAGCGGIDFHLGSMSYINADKIIQKFRAIGQNAAGYIFQLALATVSPEIKSILTEFENITNMINQLNMDSCTAAKSLVDFGRRKFSDANQDACTDYEASSGGSDDRVSGAESCRSNMAGITSGLTGENKEIYSPFKNYTYEALKNVTPINNNKDLIEALMTTMGTLIIRPDDSDRPKKIYIPPMITFEMLVNGAPNVSVISCDNADCTDISYTNIDLKAFKTYVEEEMLDILNAIANNEDITSQQKSFVQSNSVPIYKILNVLSVYPYVGTSFIKRFSESIAITLAYFWIEEGFNAITRGIKNVEDVSGIMSDYMETQRQVHEDANYAISMAKNQLNTIDIMIREVQRIEDRITKSLSKGINRGYTFANLGAN